MIGGLEIITLMSHHETEQDAEVNIQGCTELLKGEITRIVDENEMERTGMLTELMRLGEGWTESCDWKKTSSRKKYTRSLNKPAMSDLRVVIFGAGCFGVLCNRGLEVEGLHNIPAVIITVIWPVVMVQLREDTQGCQWLGSVCPWVKLTGTGVQDLGGNFLAGIGNKRIR